VVGRCLVGLGIAGKQTLPVQCMCPSFDMQPFCPFPALQWALCAPLFWVSARQPQWCLPTLHPLPLCTLHPVPVHALTLLFLLLLRPSLLFLLCSGLVIGRFVVGLGIGASAIVVPAYLAEIAPAAKRGAVVQTYEVRGCFDC
jgi:hypothetical protein